LDRITPGYRWRRKHVGANLPQAPVQDLIVVGPRMYIATDVGVFTAKRTGGERWVALGSGLPNVPVNDIRYVARNGTLYAGTFGRGIYAVRIG
jgi:photosystem II stability/assembly factor-like uncharacterized protein